MPMFYYIYLFFNKTSTLESKSMPHTNLYHRDSVITCLINFIDFPTDCDAKFL
jgi:hypothetical protein